MSKQVDYPELTWDERYRRMLDAAWTYILAAEGYVREKEGVEGLQDYCKVVRPEMSQQIASKLIKKLALRPDVEDALCLFSLYGVEVWGFGDRRYVQTELESPSKGRARFTACRGWQGIPEEKRHDCSPGCLEEIPAMLRTLNPNYEVKMTKAFPWGDDCCEFEIELKD